MLFDFIKKLFCRHSWEFIQYKNTYDIGDDMPRKIEKIYQCRNCLVIKRVAL